MRTLTRPTDVVAFRGSIVMVAAVVALGISLMSSDRAGVGVLVAVAEPNTAIRPFRINSSRERTRRTAPAGVGDAMAR